MTTVLSTRERDALYRLLDSHCGTPEGFRTHRQQKTTPCGECSRAWAISPGCKPVKRDTCGSNQGWLDHRRRTEWPCPSCAEARETHERERCGSLAGWNIHRRAGTVICDRCTAAQQEYAEQLKAERARGIRRRRATSQGFPHGNTCTRHLLRAQMRGALLVTDLHRDGLPPSVVPVTHRPRHPYDSRPWLVLGTGTRVLAQDCRAVQPEEKD